MRSRRKRTGGKLSEEEVQKYVRLLIIPLIAIILILVIVLTDNTPKHKKTKTAETQSEETTTVLAITDTESIESDTKQYIQNFDEYELKKDEIPEINALLAAYCQAKVDCDPYALAKVFGQTMTEEEAAVEKAKMDKIAQVVEDYQNITCYTKDGLQEGSYVLFPYYEIKYRDVETSMPILTWCYVYQDGEGNYIMTQEVSKEVSAYINQVGQSEDVRLLVSQVDAKADEAKANDSQLKSIYELMESGNESGGSSETVLNTEGEAALDTAGEALDSSGETMPETMADTTGDTQAQTQAAQ